MEEAAAIFDVWQTAKAPHIGTWIVPGGSVVDIDDGLARGDEMFLSKYTEAGGNAREFVQKSMLQTVAM